MINAANIITTVRILCSMAMLLCTPVSFVFYGLYIIAGLTDMVDGAVATFAAVQEGHFIRTGRGEEINGNRD